MSTSPSAAPAKRGLRDRPLGRLALLAGVLVVAFALTKGCATSGDITNEQAEDIAREVQAFEPDEVQVRFFRRGVNAHALWAVSLYQGTARRPTRVQVVVVDALTGDVVDDGR